MKHFLRVAILVTMVALFLSAWLRPSGATGRAASTSGRVAQGHSGLNAGAQTGFVPSANPRGSGAFRAVAAVLANDMWAVGSGLGTLTEHWNGTKWSLVNSPSPGLEYNDLNGVAAIASNDAWAVGSYSNNQRVPDTNTLIEHWNGTRWSLVSSPSPGPYSNTLSAVAAISSNDVWAVGNSSSGGPTLALIEHWNGSSWSVVSSPNPNNDAVLNGVVAISASNVWAVGYSFGSGFSGSVVQGTLIEHWNGSSWNVVASPSPGSSSNTLNGVTAVSACDIWAVGFQQNSGGVQQTLTEHWNGSTWSVVFSLNPGSSSNTLTGVVAVSSGDVWAVGGDESGTSAERTLIEHWNGTQWSVIASPNVGPGNNQLNGVVAISSSNAWAVGYSVQQNGPPQTLTQLWNGTQWGVVASPNRIGGGSLSGVAAISASDIWAVGADVSGALTEHWNGTKWSIVPSPSPGVNGNSLNAVVAISANDIWAVGYQYNSSSIQQTLIEYWNGSSWNVVSSPSPGLSINDLSGVTALSATDVWAVGYHDGSNTVQTLIEQWNGTQWSVVTSPNAVSGSFLYGVSAASASNVWAVGTYGTFNGVYYTLIEHWNGHAWSIVTSPSPGSAYSMLNGVAVISASNAWAVGVYSNSHFTSQTLTEHWDGSAWSVVKSPNVTTLPTSHT